MNYVATALRHDSDRVAVIAEAEEGTVRTLTYRELSDQVAGFAAGLRSLGVKHGDRVAVFLPLTVECAVPVPAACAIGVVFIPIFSGYGAEAIAGRLRDAEAKVLVCADGFYRRGQVVKMKEVADEAADGAPSVGTVVVVDRVGRAYPKRGRDVAWSDVTHVGAVLDFADTSAEDPFMVIYTSGTTGKPWNPDPWWWYFRNVGDSRCPVINYSGGTEISGGIVGCTTWTSIQPGSFTGPCPGMDADVVDDRGRSVRGAVGELVIRKPWPGMTR